MYLCPLLYCRGNPRPPTPTRAFGFTPIPIKHGALAPWAMSPWGPWGHGAMGPGHHGQLVLAYNPVRKGMSPSTSTAGTTRTTSRTTSCCWWSASTVRISASHCSRPSMSLACVRATESPNAGHNDGSGQRRQRRFKTVRSEMLTHLQREQPGRAILLHRPQLERFTPQGGPAIVALPTLNKTQDSKADDMD